MSVIPAHLRALAERAEALSAEVRTLCAGIPNGSPEHDGLTAAAAGATFVRLHDSGTV
ncbi:hypothetical protein ABGB18_00595 [Nonomuraea sp. B12E4]|uniref:hypothetical protein n=1 Tax=Nonomuraea sp. B12E4 TaxID=3153564 RepID=UPI00325CE53D